MPHSVSPEPSRGDDVEVPDAPAQPAEDIAAAELDSASQDAGEVKARSSRESPTKQTSVEDIFDDDDDGDEFSSSAQVAGSSQEPIKVNPKAKYSDPGVMRAFYQRLFPFRHLFQWLNHAAAPTNDFAFREFAFTLPNDAYLRYQSFPTADLLRKQCISMTPSRFEIGPVYTTNPRERKTLRKASAFRPIAKELVFDIDMTDYDDIRTCCSGANICHRCWTFITMAIRVVDSALREDFGFRHILWVYSGRRGAHAWVCDKRAREMDDSKRRAVAGYMELLKGGDKSGKRVNLRRPLHPHIERSLALLKDYFQSMILREQDPWAEEEKAAHLISLLPDKSLNSALQKKWDSAPGRSSASKWADIDGLASSGSSETLDTKALKEAKQDVVLEYTYPRLDAEVSKKLIHLLKSPFCVHPGTGRICVPIDPKNVEDFDPLGVPTVTQLLEEIDSWNTENEEGADGAEAKRIPDWDKTSLKPYVDYFRGFVNGLLKEERTGKRDREDEDAMEF